MSMPMYCTACDMITGHDLLGYNVKCEKCAKEHPAPWARWIFLILLLLFLFSIPILVFLGVLGYI